MELWDTSGQDKYRSVAKNYFRQADGLFIVFAMDDDRSLEGLQYWCDQAQDNVENDVPRVLLANKCDLQKELSPTAKALVEKLCDQHKFKLFLVSAKTGQNLNEAY